MASSPGKGSALEAAPQGQAPPPPFFLFPEGKHKTPRPHPISLRPRAGMGSANRKSGAPPGPAKQEPLSTQTGQCPSVGLEPQVAHSRTRLRSRWHPHSLPVWPLQGQDSAPGGG